MIWPDSDWFFYLVTALAFVGGGVAVFILGRMGVQGWKYSRMPRTRTFSQTRDEVYAAVLTVVEKSRFAVYDKTDQTITVAPHFLGGSPQGPLIPPAVHFVMLPTPDGGTQLEVIGVGGPTDSMGHTFAQELLKELDKQLAPIAE
jgi:hypothetical protein